MSMQANPDSHNHDAEEHAALLTAYAIGDLSGPERETIERQLAGPAAEEARRAVEQTRTLAAALRRAHAADDTCVRRPDVRQAVLVAATRKELVPRRSPWFGRALPVAGLAAALAVAVTAAVWRADTRDVALKQAPATQRVAGAVRRPVGDAVGSSAERPVAGARKDASSPIANLPHTHDQMLMITESAPLAPAAAAPAGRLRRWGENSQLGIEDESEGVDRRNGLDLADDRRMVEQREAYAQTSDARAVSPREQPLSTFSIDVDTASYANVRRFLVGGRRPPRDAVRIEELVNYFRYAYPQPEGDVPFSVTVDAAECPWKPGHRLVRIGLQGRDIDRSARPSGNLVFLVDVSGSMQAANKLALVKQALAMLVEELTENDRVSIVTYAGNAGLALPPTTGDQKQRILEAIGALEAGGSTHGSAGITLAYEQAGEHFIQGGSNRVILATDGDLNVGVTNTAALIELIKEKAASGTFLTVLGFGEGNLQDEKMEPLADNGNGVYAYIDGVREARKVLVEQLTGSTVTIAKDVKIQVEFNPAQVASYRLLGYENRALAARDFRDDKKDAGDIGAGHSVTALYEVVLVGDDSAAGGGAEPLKYQPQPEAEKPTPAAANTSQELLTVKLRWKRPDGDTSSLLEVPLADRGPAFDAAPADLRFAAAVAAFGMILRESSERGDATLPLVAKIAGGALGRDEGGYRAEFLDLVRKAESR